LLRLYGADGQLDRRRYADLVDQGVTIGCSWLERSLPAFANLASEATTAFGGIVNCAFIASFGSSTGYPVHYDCEDLLLLQVAGRKRWRLYGPSVPGSGFMREVLPPAGEPSQILEMQPGDVLFVPSGLRHVCEPIESSLHVGINIRWPTALWLLRALLRKASEDPGLTEPLRPFASEERLQTREAALRQRLQGLLEQTSVKQLWDEFRRGLG
ncbi:MAG: hypothetical protein KDI56_17750, partial [Xanthomonadales bacterium]|nr:hypothetical protein [Xanthomonadales bacterium]